MLRKVKIDVYLTPEHKKAIQDKANKLDISLSDYVKLKALDKIK